MVLCRKVVWGGVSPCIVPAGMLVMAEVEVSVRDPSSLDLRTITGFSGSWEDGAGDVEVESLLLEIWIN